MTLGEQLIEVCDNCLRACCWQGEFMCDEASDVTTGTVMKTRDELAALAYEDPDWWENDDA